MAESGPSSSSMHAEEREHRAIKPIYQPTPPNRPLRTPHSGYFSCGFPLFYLFLAWNFDLCSFPVCLCCQN